MSRVGRWLRHRPLLAALVVATTLGLMTTTSAAAVTPESLQQQLRANGACGTVNEPGNHSGYAGLIVVLAAKPADGSGIVALQEAQPGVKVNVATHGSTQSPPGNVIKLTSNGGSTSQGDSHIAARYHDYDFSARSSKPCKGQVVLTGLIANGEWGIDCDVSKRGEGNEQPVTAKGSGRPTVNGKKLGDGHWEISTPVKPKNGGHEVAVTTFIENDNKGWKLTPKTTANLGKVKFPRVELPAGPDSKPSKPSVNKPNGYYKGRDCSEYTNATNRSHCNTWNNYYNRLAKYNAREAAKEQNRQAARAALKRAHFTHRVGNTGKNGKSQWGVAPASDWKATIWFRVVSDARTTSWSERYNNGSPWSAKLSKGIYKQHSRSPTNVPTGNADVEAMIGDPHMGDRYCEQLRVNPSSSTGAGMVHDEDCVELAPEDECHSDPWNLAYGETVRQTDGAGNSISGDLGLGVDDAWVGESYGFFYDFDNTGPASWAGTSWNEDSSVWNGGVTLTQHWGYGPYGAPGDIAPLLVPSPFTVGIQNDENDGPGIWWLVGRAGNRSIRPADGGQTYSHSVSFTPTWGDARCNTGGAGQTPTMSVSVPYFYDLKPWVDGSAADPHTQQGNPVPVTPTVENPSRIGDRWTTWSRPTDWKLTRTAINPDTGAQTSQQVASGSGHIFKPDEADSNVLPRYTDSGAYTRTLPAGTKLCYTLTVKPRSSGSDDPVTSEQWCTIIVKVPKVQFWNSDLHVGRHFEQPDNSPTCGEPSTGGQNASVTTGSPPASVGSDNLYGSWVEYGAFASGTVSSFGSAAENKAGGFAVLPGGQRLTFANDDRLGSFAYDSWCIPRYDQLAEPQRSQDGHLQTLVGTTVDGSQLQASGYYTNELPGTVHVTHLERIAAGAKDITLNIPKGNVAIDGTALKPGVRLVIRAAGSVTISGNLTYPSSYANVGAIPRLVIIAGGSITGDEPTSGLQPNITIDEDVTRIDAWLIAHGTLYTCDTSPTSFDYHSRHCAKQLRLNGPVAAHDLRLRRTYGADLTKPRSESGPAEAFNLDPSSLLGSYDDSRRRDFIDVYQQELPPRY